MSAKLKPCPFCGCSYEKDDDDVIWSGDHDEWCPLSSEWPSKPYNVTVFDDEEMIERWNRRSGEVVQYRGRSRYLVDVCFNGEPTMSYAELAKAINALTPPDSYKYDADAVKLELDRCTLTWCAGEWVLWYEDIEE